MYEVTCLDDRGNSINHFTQWDVNQKIRIVVEGCESDYFEIIPQMHFANTKSKEALVVAEPNVTISTTVTENDTIIADVPNQLLQEAYPLFVYVYFEEGNEGDYAYLEEGATNYDAASPQRTILQTEIPVRKRVKPSDYEYVENIERITAEQIKKELGRDISNGELPIKYLTYVDVQNEIQHRVYVADHKFVIEDLGEGTKKSLDVLDERDKDELQANIDNLNSSLSARIDGLNWLDVGAEMEGTAASMVNAHNNEPNAHSDIRKAIENVDDKVDVIVNAVGGFGYNRIGEYAFIPNKDSHMTLTYVGDYAFAGDDAWSKLQAEASVASLVNDDVINAGSSIQPVYLDNGTLKAIDHTIEKSVPQDAKFTDTVQTYPSYKLEDKGDGNFEFVKYYE